MRTIASTQDSDFLLYFGNVIVAAFEVNLLSAAPILAVTSLIATTSPVSLWTPLYTTPKEPFPTCSSSLYLDESMLARDMQSH